MAARSNGPLALKLINNSQFPERETLTTLIMYKCLDLFQRKGPVIVRPALNLCQALLDTEIRLPASEFRMPYPIMGIEQPESIVKPHWPSLTIVWKMFPDTVLVWTMSPNTVCYHCLIGDDLPTMEHRLIKAEACDDQTEYNLMGVGSRIALNLCMLATFRQTELTPLPPRVHRHRRLRDQRLNRLAARHCQEVPWLESDKFIHSSCRQGLAWRATSFFPFTLNQHIGNRRRHPALLTSAESAARRRHSRRLPIVHPYWASVCRIKCRLSSQPSCLGDSGDELSCDSYRSESCILYPTRVPFGQVPGTPYSTVPPEKRGTYKFLHGLHGLLANKARYVLLCPPRVYDCRHPRHDDPV